MNIKEKSSEVKDNSFLLAEYGALRSEILKRMDVENQLTLSTIIIFGTMLSVGFQSQVVTIVLLYPILALFLSLGWAHSDYRTRQMGAYIKQRIETVAGTDQMGWESYMMLEDNWLYHWASRGIFVGTQLITIVIGTYSAIISNTVNFAFITALSVAVLCFILNFFILKRYPIKPIRL